MLDHTATAYGDSLRNDNKPMRRLPKPSTNGSLTKSSLTKSTLLLKCLVVNCVIGCVSASAPTRQPVHLVSEGGPKGPSGSSVRSSSPTCECADAIATLQDKNAVLEEKVEAILQFVGMTPPLTPPPSPPSPSPPPPK